MDEAFGSGSGGRKCPEILYPPTEEPPQGGFELRLDMIEQRLERLMKETLQATSVEVGEPSMREACGYGTAEEPRDPWRHRSEGMKCATCMWYVPKANVRRQETHLGRCRRHAPTMSGFPVVYTYDWCGDHKLNEDAVEAR